MLINRTRCKSCDYKIGLYWFLELLIYALVFSVFFVNDYLTESMFSVSVATIVPLTLFALIAGTIARFGPLKTKSELLW